jgi:hypothetical protein
MLGQKVVVCNMHEWSMILHLSLSSEKLWQHNIDEKLSSVRNKACLTFFFMLFINMSVNLAAVPVLTCFQIITCYC